MVSKGKNPGGYLSEALIELYGSWTGPAMKVAVADYFADRSEAFIARLIQYTLEQHLVTYPGPPSLALLIRYARTMPPPESTGKRLIEEGPFVTPEEGKKFVRELLDNLMKPKEDEE